MRRGRLPQSAYGWFRPSPQFQRFLDTPRAALLATLLAVGAVAGTVLAIWREHWMDALVYGVCAVVFLAWLVIRRRGRRGGPPHPAG